MYIVKTPWHMIEAYTDGVAGELIELTPYTDIGWCNDDMCIIIGGHEFKDVVENVMVLDKDRCCRGSS